MDNIIYNELIYRGYNIDVGVVEIREGDAKKQIYRRYDNKEGRNLPSGAIPCQEYPDKITGHWPHWISSIMNNSFNLLHNYIKKFIPKIQK